ncbi:ribonuclease H [Senna tora]|uniref:Ribonuclease H n=1 Tax=Senna tora TaxID=362788 RepID=A0A834WJH5_9FABA|nr:ribonuclease H [Senna tora]
MSTAYDQVEWGLLDVKCISSVSFSVKVNGVDFRNFKPERGLRHGDPYPHIYFFSVAKVLVSSA